ncbi:MAG TPA: hypothetical protein PLN85_01300 [archaeon]|nr:hypothetical protein [archaeon]
MNKSQRIFFNINDPSNNDKFIKVKLEQKVKTLEFMSLKFKTEDAYKNFNSDYGILVGRVIANDNVGIPNAKISIFIPLNEEDKNNDEIYSIYPYETPRDLNNEGKRYNLLPRVSELDQEKNIYKPKQPFGSFPIKPELVTNEVLFNVYKKYYKYTAVTNKSGDYMIFGVPTGTQTVHMSVDITDIGEFSMTPAAMVVNLGYSPNLFTDNNTKIKESSNLDDLPHIETQEINVDIIPFWGDKENFEIGITRQDFKIKATISGQFTIFGSAFTDDYESRWANNYQNKDENGNYFKKFGIGQLYRVNDQYNSINIQNKRIGNITEKIYYYPNNVTDNEINTTNSTEINNLYKKMILLNPSEYTTHKRNGDFIFIVNCNRKKMIHNEEGTLIEVSDLTQGGIYTEFKGFITLEITEDDLSTPNLRLENVIGKETRSVTLFRTRIKIPQHTTNYQTVNTSQWRNSHFTFKSNKIYSVSKFNGVVYNKKGTESAVFSNGFEIDDKINRLKKDPFFTVGVIKTTDDFPSNGFTDDNKKIFGANWLNFSIYLPQMGYVRSAEFGGLRINTCFSYDTEISGEVQSINDNSYPIAANDINTKRFIRPNLHWTDFIEVPENHIKSFNSIEKKGFKYIDDVFNIDVNELGYYRNGVNSPSWGGVACPLNGGKLYGIPTNQPDSDFYFYKGLGESDCIKFVADVLNIK